MERLAKRVLLIGWDGADWKTMQPLIDKGHMPNLERLVEHGMMGNIASLTPMLSPILWTSIATGKYADRHGILGFAEPDPLSDGLRPVTSTSRRCKALWNILSERGFRSAVVNWFASHPSEPINGAVVSDRFGHPIGPPEKDWPIPPQSVHPPELAEIVGLLRVHPATITPSQVAPFIPALAELDPQKDPPLNELRVLLARCATVHAVATYLAEAKDWDFLGVYYDAIDRFAHAFMEYHPPKLPHVSERDFERYQHVMTGCYRFHDMMLGRLMELAGPDTTFLIVSDHGFHSDHLRPSGSSQIHAGQPVAWHRPYGMLVLSGPGIKRDQRVYGASLLDVAPTILVMLGCPVARDMDGHALTQIFESDRVEPDSVDTFETPPSAAPEGAAPEAAPAADDPWLRQQMLAQLSDLGYIDRNATVESVALDRARNLGQVYAATGRPALAIPQFESVLARKPDDKGSRIAIAWCRLQMGQVDECERLVNDVLRDEAEAPLASLYMGMIASRRGDLDAALRYLQQAEQADTPGPDLQCQIGNVHLRARRWEDARRAFQKALDIDPDSAEAHDGLGVAYRCQGRPAEAVHEHMQSIGLLHHRPQTHIHLGLALAEVGQIDWAIRAFEVALEQNPHNPLPHQCLAQLYERAKDNSAKAAEHRARAVELAARRPAAGTDA